MAINSSLVQDAFHYALAALGGSWQHDGHTFESSIQPKTRKHYRTSETKTQCLQFAYQKAKAAGINYIFRPSRLADAGDMLEQIYKQCLAIDLDPFTGEVVETAGERDNDTLRKVAKDVVSAARENALAVYPHPAGSTTPVGWASAANAMYGNSIDSILESLQTAPDCVDYNVTVPFMGNESRRLRAILREAGIDRNYW